MVSCMGEKRKATKLGGGRAGGGIDCQKKGLFFAILGLFLQTNGGFEEQKKVVSSIACKRRLFSLNGLP